MSEMKLPKIGLGTWVLKPHEARYSTIQAIKLGYRFVDTAQAYRNEKGVGDGLQEVFETGIVKREEVIVATKVFPLSVRPKAAVKSTYKSLKRLQLDYVDIMYIHYPAFVLGYSHKKTLGALGKLVDEGKIRHIGVSNFTPNQIKDALEVIDKPIYANQIEHHPYLKQQSVLKFHKDKNIIQVSYSPLGRGKVLKDPVITEVAKKNKASAAQVCLAWVINKGAYPIPKATSLDHLKDNFAAIDLQLPVEDIQKIDEIDKHERYIHPPVVSPKEWKKKK